MECRDKQNEKEKDRTVFSRAFAGAGVGVSLNYKIKRSEQMAPTRWNRMYGGGYGTSSDPSDFG